MGASSMPCCSVSWEGQPSSLTFEESCTERVALTPSVITLGESKGTPWNAENNATNAMAPDSGAGSAERVPTTVIARISTLTPWNARPAMGMAKSKRKRKPEMPIPVENEKDPESWLRESCCFCWQPTPWWTSIASRSPGEQVACCPGCAKTYRVKDVPSKRYWWDLSARLRKAERGAGMAARSGGRLWCRNRMTS